MRSASSASAKVEFAGFAPDLIGFLRTLERNNNKTWFDAHRSDYEAYYLEPAKAFVRAIEPGLKTIARGLQTDARVNGSIMRINRDTRFSKDKTPYKTGLFVRFGEGPMKGAPGFGLHVHAKGIGMMGGAFGLDDAQLPRFRAALIDPKRGAAFERAIAQVASVGCGINDPHYKRVPRGFDADHPRADWLRFRALHASLSEEPVPKALFGPAALDYVLAGFAKMRPIQKWLVESL